jgi:hypothetical protein
VVTVTAYCRWFSPVANAFSASLSNLQFRHRDAARDAEVFQKIIQPRLLLPGHVLAAGDGVDDSLVEEIGDHDPQSRAAGRIGERRGQVARRRRQIVVDRRAAVGEDFRDQRAGIDHDVDQHEQPGEQQHRTELVRGDMRVKTVRGHGGVLY